MTTATMTNLISSDTFRRVLDRGEDITEVVDTLKDHWQFSLQDRRPGPAVLFNDHVKPTDLDLACLIGTLAQRNALIILPRYAAAGPKQENSGQMVIDSANRRGKLTGLSSNKDYFSFNMKFKDLNVLKADGSLGADRTFHIIGKDGRPHPGYDTINFVPNAPENKFIEDHGIAVNGVIPTKRFVTPQRWASFYGHYYFLTKCVVDHLQQEKDAIGALQKEWKKAGKQANAAEDDEGGGGWEKPESAKKDWKSVTIEVPVMEAIVDVPWVGKMEDTVAKHTPDTAKLRMSQLRHQIEALQFHARITEYAFVKAEHEAAGFPAWMKSAVWEDHKVKKTDYRRLVYADTMPGQKARNEAAIMFRVRGGKTQVDATL